MTPESISPDIESTGNMTAMASVRKLATYSPTSARISICACLTKIGCAECANALRNRKNVAVPKTARNARAPIRAARAMRVRRASSHVKRAIVRQPCKGSSRPLAAAHDFHEALLERAAPAAQLIDPAAACD